MTTSRLARGVALLLSFQVVITSHQVVAQNALPDGPVVFGTRELRERNEAATRSAIGGRRVLDGSAFEDALRGATSGTASTEAVSNAGRLLIGPPPAHSSGRDAVVDQGLRE